MRALGFLTASIVLAACSPSCSSDTLQRMEFQKKYRPYSENPLFEDGRAMRVPPEGTVPRERLKTAAIAQYKTIDGQYLAKPPLAVTPALLVRGQKRFDITCAACHGLLGNGQSPVARNMGLRPPPDLHEFASRPDGFFFDVITNGYGLMGSYAAEIPPEDRWAVVAYVRALDLSQHAPLSAAPPAEQERLKGEQP